MGGPTRVIDAEERWAQARRLLHDGTLKPEDRAAGLLVLLYAQQPATISRLTLGHIQASDGEVRLRLGRDNVVLPEPLAGLILHLAAARQGHAATGDQGTSPWLLPGGPRPADQPLPPQRAPPPDRHPARLSPVPARHRAPRRDPGPHARHPHRVAVTWQRITAGDWMTFAADVSRKSGPQPVPSRHETQDRH